jgi:hypothetical protein
MTRAHTNDATVTREITVRFWADGPLFIWRSDGTIKTIEESTADLSSWEALCAELRYGEGLEPLAIARRTGRHCAAVNSALNRVRAKADARWLTYRQARKRVAHARASSPQRLDPIEVPAGD